MKLNKKKGTGIVLKEVTDWRNMQKALNKEWSTWGNYEAVTVIPPARTKNIKPDLIPESRMAWTDKSEDMD
eukprot:1289153-Heterocapsa_arctica.AAC.1